MVRFLLFLVALAAVVVAASLGIPSDAATVNGVGISQSTLDSDLQAIAGSPGYQCYLDAQATVATGGRAAGIPLRGVGDGSTTSGTPGTYANSFARFWLNQLVSGQVVSQIAAGHGVSVSRDDLSAARQEVAAGIDGTFQVLASAGLPPPCQLTGSQIVASLPPSFVGSLAHQQAVNDALEASAAGHALDPAWLRRDFDAHRSQFDTVCGTAAGFTSATDATAAEAKVAAGTPLAKTSSTVQSVCLTPTTQYYQYVAGLKPGQVSQPIQTQQAIVLFQAATRTAGSFSQVEPVVREVVLNAGRSRATRLLTVAQARADVTVDPRYGRWTTISATRGILPPLSPPPTAVLSPRANDPGLTPVAGAAG